MKIGKTKGRCRQTGLQSFRLGYPARLIILAQARIDDALDQLENALHQVLESEHIYGEWFAVEMDQERLEALLVLRPPTADSKANGHWNKGASVTAEAQADPARAG